MLRIRHVWCCCVCVCIVNDECTFMSLLAVGLCPFGSVLQSFQLKRSMKSINCCLNGHMQILPTFINVAHTKIFWFLSRNTIYIYIRFHLITNTFVYPQRKYTQRTEIKWNKQTYLHVYMCSMCVHMCVCIQGIFASVNAAIIASN